MFISIDGSTFINSDHIVQIDKYKKVGADLPYRLRFLLSTGKTGEYCFADSPSGHAEWVDIFEKVVKST